MLRKKKQARRRFESATDLQKGSPYSYYASRSSSNEKNRKEVQGRGELPADKPHRPILGRLLLILFILLLIIAALDLTWLNSQPKIFFLYSPNSNNKTLLQSMSVYQKYAAKTLSESFSSNNKITINTGALTNKMMDQFPELGSVSIVLPVIGHQPSFYLQPAQPGLILQVSNFNYLLNNQGRVLSRKSVTDNSLLKFALPIVSNQAALTYKTGQQAMSREDIAFIEYVYEQLSLHNIAVSSSGLIANSRELDVRINSPQPYYVKFNLENTQQEQVGTYLAVYDQLQKQSVNPAQYIDVRVPGRAYFK